MNPLNYLPGSTRIKDLDTSISNSEDATVQINNQLANLDAIAANKNVGKGTPEAAAKQREIDDLRRGSEMLGPAGDPEAIETQKKEVEKNRLAREQIELKKSALNLDVKIAEAVAAGNEKEAARLQWIQDYNKQRREAKDAGMNENDAIMFATRMANADSVKGIKDIPFQHAAPLTDRLSQIGGYNSTPTFQSASSMAAIEDATKRTADAVEKANQKPDPTKPVTTQF